MLELLTKQIKVLSEYKKSLITETVTRGLNPNVKMRDSGNNWISEIPDNWKISKIKYVCSIIRGGSPRPIDNYLANDNEEGYNWIRIGDTKKGYKYIDNTNLKIIPAGLTKTRLVHKGTLLLTNSMSFGEPYILNINGCIHDGWLAFYNYINIEKEYLYYLLISETCKKQFIQSVSGAVVVNLNIDKVKGTIIPLPPLEEQKTIADFLDNKCSKIDRLLELKKKQIENIKGYKKSLIYEYVTGKMEVK